MLRMQLLSKNRKCDGKGLNIFSPKHWKVIFFVSTVDKVYPSFFQQKSLGALSTFPIDIHLHLFFFQQTWTIAQLQGRNNFRYTMQLGTTHEKRLKFYSRRGPTLWKEMPWGKPLYSSPLKQVGEIVTLYRGRSKMTSPRGGGREVRQIGD